MLQTIRITPLSSESLLDALHRQGHVVSAPCGGKGICGKCRVEVEGMGLVKSCSLFAAEPLVVHLPDHSPMQVLTESFWPDPEPVSDQPLTDQKECLGLSIDLGTTTVVIFLDDLYGHRNLGIRSFPNPQHTFGADVVSRIQYCREHPDGPVTLQRIIIEAIESAVVSLCAELDCRAGQITRMTVAGNPTMLHLFKGVNPESIALYPFTPVFLDEQRLSGRDAGFELLDQVDIEMLPSVAAYIGSDIVAGLAAVSFNPPAGWSLFLDIGTNGEMVLWNDQVILSCATAAGPAFEGARISCGMAGVEGAVSVLTADRYETIGGKPPVGLCGSGLVDAVALLLQSGQVDQMGYLHGEVHLDGTGLTLTPQDIREVQLAKGAIAAGIKILMLEAGIDAHDIRQVYMAGGFGYALHDWSAGRIGLLPDGLEKKMIRAGNTSGLGARLWLHSGEFREFTRHLTGRVRYIELSDHPEFNDLFMWEMTFTDHD